MDKIIRHAYINAIEKGFPDDGPYLRMYTRGYFDDDNGNVVAGIGAENTIDAVLLIDPNHVPFKKGTFVKITIEAVEKQRFNFSDQPGLALGA